MAARKEEKATQPQDAAQADGVGQQDEFVNPAQDELQETVEKAEDRGFLGTEVDPTPDEHYSVKGVTSGKPTPETERGQV